MQKPILFIDFFKTLNFDLYWRLLPREKFEKAQTTLFVEHVGLFDDWMRGNHVAEDINERVSKHSGIAYDELWNAFVAGCEQSRVSGEFLRALKCLKNAYEIILVTDNTDAFNRFIVPNANFGEYFDAIINTYDRGMLKIDNNGEIFRTEIERTNSEINKSVLLDDRLDICTLYRELGGIALHVTEQEPTERHLDTLKKVLF